MIPEIPDDIFSQCCFIVALLLALLLAAVVSLLVQVFVGNPVISLLTFAVVFCVLIKAFTS